MTPHEELIKEIKNGLIYHIIIDGKDHAWATALPKEGFIRALTVTIFSMVASAYDKGLITEEEYQKLRP